MGTIIAAKISPPLPLVNIITPSSYSSSLSPPVISWSVLGLKFFLLRFSALSFFTLEHYIIYVFVYKSDLYLRMYLTCFAGKHRWCKASNFEQTHQCPYVGVTAYCDKLKDIIVGKKKSWIMAWNNILSFFFFLNRETLYFEREGSFSARWYTSFHSLVFR